MYQLMSSARSSLAPAKISQTMLILQSRWVTTSNTLGMGFGSHMSENHPETLHAEVQRSREGKVPLHVPSAPGWNEKLASDSEAVVKAERDAVMSVETNVEEMQSHSVRVLHEHYSYDAEVKVKPLGGQSA